MNASKINHRAMAEEWLAHVAQQYYRVHICRRDLPLIEHFLKAGFTLVAVRDALNVLRVDFLGRKSLAQKHSRSRA